MKRAFAALVVAMGVLCGTAITAADAPTPGGTWKIVYSSAEVWLRFYMDCDSEIREAMTDYIVEVYAPKCGNFDEDKLEAMRTAQF